MFSSLAVYKTSLLLLHVIKHQTHKVARLLRAVNNTEDLKTRTKLHADK
jgi:hypothetical protein